MLQPGRPPLQVLLNYPSPCFEKQEKPGEGCDLFLGRSEHVLLGSLQRPLYSWSQGCGGERKSIFLSLCSIHSSQRPLRFRMAPSRWIHKVPETQEVKGLPFCSNTQAGFSTLELPVDTLSQPLCTQFCSVSHFLWSDHRILGMLQCSLLR